MKKLDKRIIALSSVVTLLLVFYIPHFAFAGSFLDTICDLLAGIVKFFGDGAVFICDTLGGQFDKLIFNYDGDTFQNDLNLIILKGDKLSGQIMSLYKAIQFIAACILVTVSLWITVDFVKTADNPQHKAILLDRLKKLILSIFLLTSIPVLIDVMMAINYAICDMFRSISLDFASSSVDYGKSFLTGAFSDLYENAEGSEALVIALAYLIAGVINIWLIIFYMIRDLAIAFLLIMAPFMCCILPYRTDLLVTWFKEMGGNIFTQSIQALVFCVDIAIISGISNDSSDLYSQIFALVAFSMFIPMTGMIKRLIGLEGNIGASKSNAGVGAAVMAMALAGRTVSGIKNQAGMFYNSHQKINDLKAERDNLGNGQHSSEMRPLANYNTSSMDNKKFGFNSGAVAAMSGMGEDGGQLGMTMAMSSMSGDSSGSSTIGNVDTRNFPRDRNVIQGEISAIRKQRLKNMAGSTMGGLGTAAFTIAGSGLGTLGAFAGGQMGATLGESIGTAAGSAVFTGASKASQVGQDIMYGRGIRPELESLSNGNRNWNIGNAKYNIDNMKKNMSTNIDKMKSDMKYSPINTDLMPHDGKEYENLKIAKQARQDEFTGLTGDPLRGTEYYENESDSILHTQDLIRRGEFQKASRYRTTTSSPRINKAALERAEANEDRNLNTMLYTDKNSSILFSQNNDTGEREVLGTYPGNPNLETPTMEDVSFNMVDDAPITDAQRLDYREQAVNLATERYGADSITNEDSEFYNAANKLIDVETNKMIGSHVSKVENLRKSTGSKSITLNGSVGHDNVTSVDSIPNMPSESKNIDVSAQPVVSSSQPVSSVPNMPSESRTIDVPVEQASSSAQPINDLSDYDININDIDFSNVGNSSVDSTPTQNVTQHVNVQASDLQTQHSVNNVQDITQQVNVRMDNNNSQNPQDIDRTIPNIAQEVDIRIPNSIQGQHARNIYANIESSKVNIATKQLELMQQQAYTDSLKQGIDQLETHTPNYNGQFN